MSAETRYICAGCGMRNARSKMKAQYRRAPRFFLSDAILLHCTECGGKIEVFPPEHHRVFVGKPTDENRDNVFIETHYYDDRPATLLLLPPSAYALKKTGAAYTWGYGGSGPHALAHSMLAWVYDEHIADRYHHQFVWTIVAGWDQHAPFAITMDRIIQWLDQWQADVDYVEQNKLKGQTDGS